jgi:hypothetical protein
MEPRQHLQLRDSETQAELIREARKSALVMVLCDVLPDVPVAELYKAAVRGRDGVLAVGAGHSRVDRSNREGYCGGPHIW